jgi:hypothetical protein
MDDAEKAAETWRNRESAKAFVDNLGGNDRIPSTGGLIPRPGASKRLTFCTSRLPNLNRYSRAAMVQQ